MTWTKDFYTKQYELLESPAAWARFFPAEPPARRKRPAEAIARLSGPGAKRVLELGCGGGLTAGAIALLVIPSWPLTWSKRLPPALDVLLLTLPPRK